MLTTGAETRFPATDGTNVAYLVQVPSYDWGLALNDGTRDVMVTEPTEMYEYTAGSYSVAGGWLAYVTWSRSQHQYRLWRRPPNGTPQQLGSASAIKLVTLSPTGVVTYLQDNQLVLDEPNRPLVVLAASVATGPTQAHIDHVLGRTWYVGDRLTLDLDGYLYILTDPQPVHLTIRITGHGTVTLSPYDQACRGTCTFALSPGALLSLHATADLPGWRFSGWGGACTGADRCVFRVDVDTALSATFSAADTTAPTVTAPTVRLAIGSQLPVGVPAAVPLDVSWTSSDPDDGVAASDLEYAVNGGGFAAASLPSAAATGASFPAAVGATYTLRARGTDEHGNVGDWVEGPLFARPRWSTGSQSTGSQSTGSQATEPPDVTVLAQQETAAALTGAWTTGQASDSWGGSTVTAHEALATATFTVQGEYVGIVCATGPGRADAEVFVDGQPRGSFATASLLTTPRRVLAVVALPWYHTHTIRLVSTSADPLELDGVVILR